ncbi:acyl-CoA reductase [Lacihabitans sp. LS3-19]|uniref:acyl-CoA reductase n=1 Tax=Lacihabitans sp. LS3-19 TaxID=2487335 RepID=UPI0020CE9FB1|nr:acyl-CoA reductase [Lacihabitans sp. LS3-19]MCP9769805.1 acyl-CoA reductase [Lacihabitans sp. LS3-19]
MKLEDRIVLFSELGNRLNKKKASEEFLSVLSYAKSKNGWFTLDNLIKSIESVINHYLNNDKILEFVKSYNSDIFTPKSPKKVGIVAAGNIPLVGIQDLIHVILMGHIAIYKASTQDEVLIRYLLKEMIVINPEIEKYLILADRLNDSDAFIATGSDNTSRYFDYYFASKPHIIRKNRTSVAILSGNESKIQLSNLGNDIFSYFGLGCRNVAKLFVPRGYDFTTFFESVEYWNTILMHSKYNNNYDYMKSIYLVNRVEHLDNGFLLLKEDTALSSPISTLFFEYYDDVESLKSILGLHKDQIQVIVSDLQEINKAYGFGLSQSPGLADYADDIDTIEFLTKI